ncbi:hypothetical protein C6N75_08705 [Streptomyces solincola]|uniref:DUF7847 domain-containing protein n=1 Tax=Streptomyces solincola TaxID=2100817 RepID=A0A2S9PZ15_9ACTN|nr:hypothetical protein [Streptomyces solincola]PRH79597.1 hypothetical protein C6N75_08705 [Streptomyces solincola]
MNDTPGWTSPGSSPSDDRDASGASDGRSADASSPTTPSGRPEDQSPAPAGPADGNGSADGRKGSDGGSGDGRHDGRGGDAGDGRHDNPAGHGKQWAADQPPAGQWSPPAAPGASGPVPPHWGGAPPYGPGGHGGWNGGNWGRPPAAKPGVIPLRPLSVGEILDGAVSTLRAHWRTVLAITITVSVIVEIGSILVERYLIPPPPEISPDATPEEALNAAVDSMQSSLASLGPTVLLSMISSLFLTALLTTVISRSVLGRPVSLADAWRESRPRLPHLLGLLVVLPLVYIAVMVVALLPGLLLSGTAAGIPLIVLGSLGGIVALVWLYIRFALASSALMLERQGVLESLKRSAKLVRGAWWRTFGIMALAVLLVILVAMIIGIPFGLIALAADGDGFSGLINGSSPDFGWPFLIITGVGSVLASAITYPILSGVPVLLYIDQRIRREALDLELARAAGVPGYGPPADSAPRG